nr:Crp/Fnr family transcriptional regulator [uncultured Chitinophaga sp.]
MYPLLADKIAQITSIDEDGMKTVLSYFRHLQVKKDEILLNEGEKSSRIYFVVKGCLRIYFLQTDGTEATRYLAFENNFASNLVGLITQDPSEEFIQAAESAELLYIHATDFFSLLNIVPGWEKFYRYYLEHAYVNNTRHLMSFLTMDATERYKQLLKDSPIIVQRLSNKMVANYLGISQESLSRLKGRLND